MWFAKRITVFQKKDRDMWQKVKDVLKSAGLNGVKAGHYEAESLRRAEVGLKLWEYSPDYSNSASTTGDIERFAGGLVLNTTGLALVAVKLSKKYPKFLTIK